MVFLPDRFLDQLKIVTSFSFACAAGVARPSFQWRSPYSRFAVDVVENLLRIVLGSPALEQFSSGSSGALPPWNSSSPGSSWAPAIWWFFGRSPGPSPRQLPSAELSVDWELLPSVSEPGPGWLGRTLRILGCPEVASASLALPGSKALFYFWDIESEIHITLPLFVMII